MSLVDSCPSTLIRSNDRFTASPSSRSALWRSSAASVCTKHSIVAKRGEIIPAPFACAARVRCLPADRPSAPRACRSRRWCGSRRETGRVGAERRDQRRQRRRDSLIGQRHADHPGRGDRDLAGSESERRRGGLLDAGGRLDPGLRRSLRWRYRSSRRPRGSRRARSGLGSRARARRARRNRRSGRR